MDSFTSSTSYTPEGSHSASNTPNMRRVPKACDTCHHRKVKCDGVIPCATCNKAGITCSFNRSPKKRESSHSAGNGSILNPNDQFITAFYGGKVFQHSGSTLSEPASPNVNWFKRKPSNQETDSVTTSSESMPHWPRSHLQSGARSHSGSTGSLFSGGSISANNTKTAFEEYPDLIDYFFEKIHPMVWVFHEATFRQNLKSLPPSLLLAVYALTSAYAFVRGHIKTYGDRAQEFYFRSKEMLTASFEENIHVIQAYILLTTVASIRGELSAAWTFSGMAVTTSFALNLDKDPEENNDQSSPIEKETKRRIWWMCYTAHRFICATTMRQSIINDAECTNSLILDDYSFQSINDKSGKSPFFGVCLSAFYTLSEIELRPFINSYNFSILLRSFSSKVLDYIRKRDNVLEHNAKEILLTEYSHLGSLGPEEWLAKLKTAYERSIAQVVPAPLKLDPQSYKMVELSIDYFTQGLLIYCPHIVDMDPSQLRLDIETSIFCYKWAVQIIDFVRILLSNDPTLGQANPSIGLSMFYSALIIVYHMMTEQEVAVIQPDVTYLNSAIISLRHLHRLWDSLKRFEAELTKIINKSDKVQSLLKQRNIAPRLPIHEETSPPTVHSNISSNVPSNVPSTRSNTSNDPTMAHPFEFAGELFLNLNGAIMESEASISYDDQNVARLADFNLHSSMDSLTGNIVAATTVNPADIVGPVNVTPEIRAGSPLAAAKTPYSLSVGSTMKRALSPEHHQQTSQNQFPRRTFNLLNSAFSASNSKPQPQPPQQDAKPKMMISRYRK